MHQAIAHSLNDVPRPDAAHIPTKPHMRDLHLLEKPVAGSSKPRIITMIYTSFFPGQRQGLNHETQPSYPGENPQNIASAASNL
jgi:hypothetical protein